MPVAAANSTYQERLARARVTYGKAESRLRAVDMAASIAAALDAFEAVLERMASAIARRSAGRDTEAPDAQDTLRALSFQRDMLVAALAQAARADQKTANRADPSMRVAAVQIAKAQQAADGVLASRIEELMARVQRDFAAAGRPTARAKAPARTSKKAARPARSKPARAKKKAARPRR